MTHSKAIASYKPGDGFLVLSKREEHPPGMANYDTWLVEEPPVTANTELEALRLYYSLTRKRRIVRIYPDLDGHCPKSRKASWFRPWKGPQAHADGPKCASGLVRIRLAERSTPLAESRLTARTG